MANEIGELIVRLLGDTAPFEKSMQAAEASVDQAMAKISGSIDRSLTAATGTMTKFGESVKSGLAGVNQEFAQMSNTAGPKLIQLSGNLAGITTIAFGVEQGLEKMRREIEKMPEGSGMEGIKAGLDSILSVLQPVTIGLTAVTAATSGLAIALPLLATPAGAVGIAIAGITAAAYAMYESFQQSMTAVKGADTDFQKLGSSINFAKDKLDELNQKMDLMEERQKGGVKVHVVTASETAAAAAKKAAEAAKAAAEIEKEELKRQDQRIAKYREMEALVEANRKATEKAAEGLNDYNDAVAKAAEAQRDKTSKTQLDVVWTGKQAEVLKEVTDQIRAQEEANRSNTTAAKDNNTQIQRQSELSREVSTIMTDLGRNLARAILHWKGFKEAGLSALEAVGEAITRQLIDKLLESTKIIDRIVDGLAKVFGLSGGKGGGTSVPIPGIPGSGGGGGGGAGGAVAGAAISGVVGAAAGVVGAVSSIIGNFQMAHMNTALGRIEENTRYSQIHLGYLLEKANEYWPYLQHINSTLWTPGAPGGVGGTQITVNYTGDVRSLAMMLLSELQRMGLRVSPA